MVLEDVAFAIPKSVTFTFPALPSVRQALQRYLPGWCLKWNGMRSLWHMALRTVLLVG